MKRANRSLTVDDEIDNKVMTLLEIYAKYEPNSTNPPITAVNVKDRMNNELNIRRLVKDKSYNISPHKLLFHIRGFMRLHQTDYVCTHSNRVFRLRYRN